MTPGDRRPHVGMLVRNRFTHDTRVEKEATTLVAAGYDVTVVADGDGRLPATEERDGYRVRRVARRAARLPVVRFLVHRRDLMRELAALQPDVLHAHDSDALEPVSTLAARLGIPFVYDAHDLWLGRFIRGHSRLGRRVYLAYYRRIERRHIPRAAATLTVSPPIVDHLARVYGIARPHLVPNYPEVPEAWTEPRQLRELTEEGAIPEGSPIVVYVGGIVSGRGLEELVEAVRDVPGAHLVFIGPGEHGPVLLDLARRLGVGDRTHMIPPVASSAVMSYAASADVGVSTIVPSCLNYRYSLPNKLFQYMGASLPVVASHFSQMRSVVEANDAGVTVDPENPADIAAALRTLLADRDGARRMGANGRRAVEREYNWSTAARELLAAYRSLDLSPR